MTGRELDNPVLLLDTIFYRKSPAFQGTQAGSKWQVSITLSVRVISWDSKETPWNCIENSTTLNYSLLNPRLTSRYNFLSKITRSDRARTRQPHLTSRYNFLSKITRSDIDATLCQFEWWRGDSRAIVSRTRLNDANNCIEKYSKWHWQAFIIDAGNTGQAFGITTFIAGPPRFYGVQFSVRF